MTPSTTAQLRLKEKGNALFVKKDFAHAHDTYAEAIAIDGQNTVTVLYANRSACGLGMGQCARSSDVWDCVLLSDGLFFRA